MKEEFFFFFYLLLDNDNTITMSVAREYHALLLFDGSHGFNKMFYLTSSPSHSLSQL